MLSGGRRISILKENLIQLPEIPASIARRREALPYCVQKDRKAPLLYDDPAGQ